MPDKPQTSSLKRPVSRVADRKKLSLLLDKARQFAGEYIDSLEERPVFPGEKSLRAMDALVEPLPENPAYPIPGSRSAPGNRRARPTHALPKFVFIRLIRG